MAETIFDAVAGSNSEAIANLSEVEQIDGTSLFDAVNSSTLASIGGYDSRFYKVGRIVYGIFRFALITATTGSTTLFTPKSSALKSKWYPIAFGNYAVFSAYKVWDASKTALCFINDAYDFGIGKADTGEYIVPIVYISRA